MRAGPLYCADRAAIMQVKLQLAFLGVGFAVGMAFGIMIIVLRGVS